MTCKIARPTPQVLFDTYKDMFSATVLGGGEVIPESNEWYVTSLNYAIAETFYAISEEQWARRDPRNNCCEDLIEFAALDGMHPNSASFAEGYAIITGTAGSKLIPDLQIAFNEQAYKATGSVPTVMPATGSIVVRMRALQAGVVGNSVNGGTAGTAATLTTPLPGINADVVICGGQFCGGAEKEECEAFRTRYLARKQFAPRATASWMRQKLLEWPCATRVCERSGSCCIPVTTDCSDECVQGKKEFNFYVLFDGTFSCGLAPQSVVDEISLWMFGERQGYGEGQVEVGICGKIYTASPVATKVSIAGAACYTTSQRNEIIEQITDLFTTFCPSQIVSAKQVELVISQVLGYVPDLEVTLSTTSTNADITPCGDIEPHCDYMGCLDSIVFDDEGQIVAGCT